MNYTPEELQARGIKFGRDVQVHRTVEFFHPEKITLGSSVRIDCFAVISADAPVVIGNHVHLAVGTAIFGAAGVEIGDFAGLSCRTTVFTASDDYRDGYLTNPTVPTHYRKVQTGRVVLGPHVVIGSGAVILPGVTLARGVSVGALSLVNKSVPEFLIVAGNPIRKLGTRNRERLDRFEREFLEASPLT